MTTFAAELPVIKSLPLMKRTIFLLELLSVVMLTGCSDSGISPEDVVEQKTAIIYFSAQNSLSRYVMRDMREIAAGAPSLNRGETVVVYLDRDEGSEIYVFDRTHSDLTPTFSFEQNLDSSDPATMARILKWTKDNYPAKNYGLTLWSHADGWLPPLNTDYLSTASRKWTKSFGVDDGNDAYDTDRGTSISIEDLATVVRNSGMKFRYLFFDACLMQSLEVDYALRNMTDYIIASPISTTADGAYYTNQLTDGLFADDPADIARTYYDDVAKKVSSSYSMGMVVSAVKTAGLDSLAALTRKLMQKNDIDPSIINGQWPLDDAQNYSTYSSRTFYRPDCYDAAEAMEAILPEEDAALWRKQLNNCVVYKGGTPTFYIEGAQGSSFVTLSSDYSGVSMFVPQQKYTDNAGICPYGDLNEAWLLTDWAKALTE